MARRPAAREQCHAQYLRISAFASCTPVSSLLIPAGCRRLFALLSEVKQGPEQRSRPLCSETPSYHEAGDRASDLRTNLRNELTTMWINIVLGRTHRTYAVGIRGGLPPPKISLLRRCGRRSRPAAAKRKCSWRVCDPPNLLLANALARDHACRLVGMPSLARLVYQCDQQRCAQAGQQRCQRKHRWEPKLGG